MYRWIDFEKPSRTARERIARIIGSWMRRDQRSPTPLFQAKTKQKKETRVEIIDPPTSVLPGLCRKHKMRPQAVCVCCAISLCVTHTTVTNRERARWTMNRSHLRRHNSISARPWAQANTPTVTACIRTRNAPTVTARYWGDRARIQRKWIIFEESVEGYDRPTTAFPSQTVCDQMYLDPSSAFCIGSKICFGTTSESDKTGTGGCTRCGQHCTNYLSVV